MNRKNLCVFLLTMTTFMMQVSGDNNQSKKNRIDRLVHEVGERIKAREKHIGNEETQPDSIITCYEKDIDPKIIFGMYQALCNKTAHEDEATVITVSFCSEGNDEDSKKKLMANFIYALQSQIDSNRTYTRKDGLYLTLNHIRYADVEHLDLLNSHVMQMRSIHKKFDVKFIKKMEEIAYIFLKRKIMQRYEIILSAMVNIPTSDVVNIDCNMKNKEKVLKVILGFFEDFESYGCPIDVINSTCKVFQHSMNRMISEIVAESDQLSSEKDNLNADLTDYFKYLATKKFYTSLLRCVNDLAISFSKVFEKAEAEKAFSDFYSCFIEKINKRIELSQKKIGSLSVSHHDSTVEHKNQRALDAARAPKTSKQSEDCDLLVNLDRNLSDERKDYDSLDEIEDTSGTDLPFERVKCFERHVVEQVMQDSNLGLMYQSFFRSLFELILRSFQTSMQTQKDNILDKLYSEKEFSIVINGIVTPDNFYDLVRIVNDGNILEGSCDGQVLFIVKGKSPTHSDIGIYDPKRDNANLDPLSPSITLKVLSKITPTNIGSFDNANHLGKYKTHETKVTKDGCKTHQETFEAPNENPHVVGLFEAHIPHETSDDTVNCLMTRCQEHGGQIITHNIVLIVKDTESIGIHILFQRRDDTNRTEIISIIYNPKPIAEKHDLRCFTTLEAKTICLFNIPVTILNDLDHSLMCLLVQDTKFNIPNILTLQNRNLIYTEQIIDIESNTPFAYLREYFIQKFDCDEFFRISNSISIKDIAKYLYKKNYGGDNVIIDAFVKKIGIQLDEFNDILHSVIFNEKSLEADADWSFEVDRVNTGFEVVVYMTHHDDNSRVLNICQAEENRYGDKISIGPYSIFRKLLENEEFYSIMQNMNHDTEPSVPEKAFIMLVFNKIYEHICYNSSAYSGRCNLDKRKKEYAKDIVENIHIMIDQNQKSFDNKSPGSQAYHTQLQQFLLKLAVPETIERMFETMIKEMLKIKWQRTMKITSIKFSNMGDNGMCNGSDKLSERSNAKFVDVEHLTCQDCQSLQGCRECQNCVAKMQQHTTSK